MAEPITTEPAGRRLVVRTSDGQVLADSENALILHEKGHPDRPYFPREDVRMDLLTPNTTKSHCPYKGDNRYWDAPGAKDGAWSYEQPFERRTDIKGLIGFWEEKGLTISER